MLKSPLFSFAAERATFFVRPPYHYPFAERTIRVPSISITLGLQMGWEGGMRRLNEEFRRGRPHTPHTYNIQSRLQRVQKVSQSVNYCSLELFQMPSVFALVGTLDWSSLHQCHTIHVKPF